MPADRLLGVDAIGDDGRYTVKTAVDLLSGEVWFRSNLQLGLTVDEWGDGLLLLAQSPSVPGAASMFLCATESMLHSWPISNPDGQHGGATISRAGATEYFAVSACISNVCLNTMTR